MDEQRDGGLLRRVEEIPPDCNKVFTGVHIGPVPPDHTVSFLQVIVCRLNVTKVVRKELIYTLGTT